jgi:hypothetical protein
MSAGIDPLEAAPPAAAIAPAPAATEADELPAPRPRRGPGGPILWAQVALAVLLLAASAAGRYRQSLRVDQMLRDGRVPPFHLADLPMTLGPWTGHDEALDPIIARATGSTEQFQRIYQHGTTGQRVAVLVLFGPSSEMFIHAPEVCYPAAGYALAAGPIPRSVAATPSASGGPWRFNELVYVKGEGGRADQRDVYYSWRYSGAWTPGLATQKTFERIPGMFKVQVDRAIKASEMAMLDEGNPCEAFLAHLMPEIDGRIAAAEAARHGPGAPRP